MLHNIYSRIIILQKLLYAHVFCFISEAGLDTEKLSSTCNTAVVTGGVGGVMGLIILILSVLVVVLLVIVLSQYNIIKKRAERLVMKGQSSTKIIVNVSLLHTGGPPAVLRVITRWW